MSTPSITVYTKPACIECQRTKAALKQRGLSYVEVNVENDIPLQKHLKGEGFMGLPVVKVGNHTWGGHQSELIDRIPKEVVS